MRTAFVIAAVVPGLLALTPAAFAETTTEPLPVWLELSPPSGQTGATVSVTAACASAAGPLTSTALRVTEPLARNAEGHQPWALFGEAMIRAVPPGSYPVPFRCGEEPVTVHFSVVAKGKAAKPQTAVVPKGAPQTGDGSL